MRSRINGTLRLANTNLTPAHRLTGEVLLTACCDGTRWTHIEISPTRLAAVLGCGESTVFRALTALARNGIITRQGVTIGRGPDARISKAPTHPKRVRDRICAQEVTVMDIDELFAGLDIPDPAPAPEKPARKPRTVQPFQEVALLFTTYREQVLGTKLPESQRRVTFKQAKDLLSRFTKEEITEYWEHQIKHRPDKLASVLQLAWISRDLAAFAAEMRQAQEETAHRASLARQQVEEINAKHEERARQFREKYGAQDDATANARSRALDSLRVPEALRAQVIEGFKRDQPAVPAEYVKDWASNLDDSLLWGYAREVLNRPAPRRQIDDSPEALLAYARRHAEATA
ncbi:hypothetical protein IHN63_00380 [Deinococcus sp. 6YEL10]|uniref:helix-turn-helix domain-containing protein n=1 Tax=Deinococcus sp. 6YEL10 TaxID=2745870 RepID=UPI001E3EE76F|nr:helix-turn-helix domain-containing protein [Deinococcus sp. 6YEL10]MCD0159755.1 hypothetical protein [Deinococcus sp. 6YEL10]